MLPDQIKLRGRLFTLADLEVIQSCVEEFFEEGRSFISQEVCRRLDWKQPNGWLKDRACRDVLLKLHKSNLIKLPPPKISTLSKTKECKPVRKKKRDYLTAYTLTDLPNDVSLIFAKGNFEETIWNQIVEENHYLGHKVIVGRCIKYLVMSGNKILSAIAFSSPAWHLEARDELLSHLDISSSDTRNLVINNSRFLIMPDARVKNLASYTLALSTKAIVEDWEKYYSIRPLFVETFVQPSKFSGTCYKAANWLEVGMTKGYAKSGSSYHNSQEPKKVFLYGLTKTTRELLNLALNKQRG